MSKSPVKPKLKSRGTNHIVMVLDRSSSMDAFRDGVVDTIKRQFTEHRTKSAEIEQDTKVSLFTFSDVVDEPVFFNHPISDAEGIMTHSYVPQGWTALLDGIGQAVSGVSKLKHGKNHSNLLVVLTDGMENHSTKFTVDTIRTLLAKCLADGDWSLVFFCPPGYKQSIVDQFKIPAGNVREWEGTAKGFAEYKTSSTRMIDNFYQSRSIGATASCNLFDAGGSANLAIPTIKSTISDA